MRFGAQVRSSRGLLSALAHGEAIGAEVVQVFTQSPRMWKPSQYPDELLAAYRAAAAAQGSVGATYCHATYLINLAAGDREVRDRSRACLAANLAVARGMGAAGLVLHPGSHRGQGFERRVSQVADLLTEAFEGEGGEGAEGCPILLENTAGAGGTIGRSFEELAELLARAGPAANLGVCLDTQHLWASGMAFGTPGQAAAVVDAFDQLIGLGRLRCLHLNDSKVPFGANRDRHENLGAGTIGTAGLGALLGHPALQGLPAILEVPGSGGGPRHEDLVAARRAHARGLAWWRRLGGAQPGGGWSSGQAPGGSL